MHEIPSTSYAIFHMYTHSELYPWDRGTWQGAGSSPVLFCILLHHMMVKHDPEAQDAPRGGTKCKECRSPTVRSADLRCPVCAELLAHAQGRNLLLGVRMSGQQAAAAL